MSMRQTLQDTTTHTYSRLMTTNRAWINTLLQTTFSLKVSQWNSFSLHVREGDLTYSYLSVGWLKSCPFSLIGKKTSAKYSASRITFRSVAQRFMCGSTMRSLTRSSLTWEAPKRRERSERIGCLSLSRGKTVTSGRTGHNSSTLKSATRNSGRLQSTTWRSLI